MVLVLEQEHSPIEAYTFITLNIFFLIIIIIIITTLGILRDASKHGVGYKSEKRGSNSSSSSSSHDSILYNLFSIAKKP